MVLWMKWFVKDTRRTLEPLHSFPTVSLLLSRDDLPLNSHFTCQYSLCVAARLCSPPKSSTRWCNRGQTVARKTHSSPKTCNRPLHQIRLGDSDGKGTKVRLSKLQLFLIFFVLCLSEQIKDYRRRTDAFDCVVFSFISPATTSSTSVPL